MENRTRKKVLEVGCMGVKRKKTDIFCNFLDSTGPSNCLEINSAAPRGMNSHRLTLHRAGCLPQLKPAWFPRQPQSHIFPINKTGKERHYTEGAGLRWSWRRRRGRELRRRRRTATRLNQTEQTRLLQKKKNTDPANIKIVFVSLQRQTPFSTSHKVGYFPTIVLSHSICFQNIPDISVIQAI
ncbi:hypothetical protein FQA47_020504 [Oryzias melastigma]|uniref:Uncharacterized protein n=1 Tax=Oryzias melastigma TaxID=30732 RepID=A0A834CSM2_ORYME|nr:hypothetical protein FQA47_020504 [Oryzias melastigma]